MLAHNTHKHYVYIHVYYIYVNYINTFCSLLTSLRFSKFIYNKFIDPFCFKLSAKTFSSLQILCHYIELKINKNGSFSQLQLPHF